MTRIGAALLAAVYLAGCAISEPEAPLVPPQHWKTRKPVDPEAQLAMVAAYRAACLGTSLDLGGAATALRLLGYGESPGDSGARRFAKGETTVEITVGEAQPVRTSYCVVINPRVDRFAAIDALDEAIRISGLRYEAKDLAALGDPDAHDVRGTAVGSNFWGVASIVDGRNGAGVAMLKSPKKRE